MLNHEAIKLLSSHLTLRSKYDILSEVLESPAVFLKKRGGKSAYY
jgi:hypothetical protein